MTTVTRTSANTEHRPNSLLSVLGAEPSNLIDVGSLSGWAWLSQQRATPLPLTNTSPTTQRAWVDSLYIPTCHDDAIQAAVADTIAQCGGSRRQWLAIDGPANLGKSEAIIHMCLTHTQFTRDGDVIRRDGARQLPFVYVEADASHRGAGLLDSICRFAGVPQASSETKMRQQLTTVLPRLGTRVIVVDDAHMLRRSGNASTRLPDTLRALLRMRVTFVFVGAGLDDSALLKRAPGPGYESTDQMRQRSTLLPLAPMRLPDSRPEFMQLIRRYGGRLGAGLPHLTLSGLKDPEVLQSLFHLCDGYHGDILATLKKATNEAIRTQTTDLNAALIINQCPTAPGEVRDLDNPATKVDPETLAAASRP